MIITKEGALASFYTVNKAPIKHLKVYFSPKQAGSGDPSPENVRAINGYTGIFVDQTSKNLFGGNALKNALKTGFINGTINDTTITYEMDSDVIDLVPLFTQFKSNTQYTFIYTISTSAKVYSHLGILYTDGSYVHLDISNYPGSNIKGTYIKTSNASKSIAALVVTRDTFSSVTFYCNESGIFEGNIDIDQFEPYRGHTYNLDWSLTLGTIYGGYVDLITGELMQTFAIEEPNNNNWYISSSYAYQWGHAKCNVNDYNSLAYLNSLSSHWKVTRYDNPNFVQLNINGAFILGREMLQAANVDMTNEAITNYINDQKEKGTPIQAGGPLITPIAYQLTPTQLQTFIGQNNIWSNADRVEVEYDLAESNDELYRRRNIILQSAPHLQTVSGNIANFNTDLVAPIKDAKIYFNPIQAGNGDPSPENIREIQGFSNINLITCGKNLFNTNIPERQGVYLSDSTTATNLVYTNNTDYNVYKIKIKPATQYTFGPIKSGNSPLWATMRNDSILSRFSYIKGGTDGKYITFTAYSSDAYLLISVAVSGTYKCDDNLQLFEGENEIEYQSSNYIPITFPAVGKNLLDITKTSKINFGATDSTITIANNTIAIDAVASSARSYVLFSQIFPPGTYTISAQYSGSVGCPKLLSTTEFNDSSYNTYYTAYTRSLNPQTNSWTFTLLAASQLGIVLPNLSNEAGNPGTVYNVQIESGSSATTYEPYNNTIYGGYVDLINGEIITTYKQIIFDGSDSNRVANFGNSSYNGTLGTNRGLMLKNNATERTSVNSGTTNCYCDKIAPSSVGTWSKPDEHIWQFYINNHYQIHVVFDNATVGITNDMDWGPRTAAINTWLSNNPLTFIIPLETPVTYQLTPQQLKTLKGSNNIWSDANGPIEVQYWTH